MEKIYTALGLMSGTSLDGIDASIVRSDGEKFINIEENQYYKYNDSFRERLRKFIKGCYDKEYIDKHNKIFKQTFEVHFMFVSRPFYVKHKINIKQFYPRPSE